MARLVVLYRCESWTIKKAECWRTDAFELWCWRRLLSPLDCKEIKPVNPRGNQFWTFFGRADAETEAPIFWSPDAKSRHIGKDPDTWKVWGQEEKGWQLMRWLDGIINSKEMNLSKLQEIVKGKFGVLQSMGSQRVGHNLVTGQLKFNS